MAKTRSTLAKRQRELTRQQRKEAKAERKRMRTEEGKSGDLDSMLAVVDTNGQIIPIQSIESAVSPAHGGEFTAPDTVPSTEVTQDA